MAIQKLGPWLIAEYEPTALFSLRMSHSTSSGGKTLFVPTPYAFKVAVVDAAFRVQGEALARQVFGWLKARQIRFKPPKQMTVNHTFIKIRREPKKEKGQIPEEPYISSIAFREFCFYRGKLQVAVEMGDLPQEAVSTVENILAHINYLGKRGSFMQFYGSSVVEALPRGFTLPAPEELDLLDPDLYRVIQFLDELGQTDAPDLFDRINSYSDKTIELGKHRVLKQYFLPYKMVQSTRSYTYYVRPN